MKRSLLTAGSAVLLIVISGCSSVNWKNVGYVSPANEVNLKANPRVKIVAVGNKEMMMPVINAISGEFAKNGQFKLDEKNPDYWIILNGKKMYRADNPQEALYNRSVKKLRESNRDGGRDYLKTTDYKSSAAAASMSVAVYSVKDLAPVYYFDVVMYDSDFLEGKVRSQNEYYKLFTEQIINKFNDAFLIQKRTIETAIPKNADPILKDALVAGNAGEVIEQAKAYLPEPFEKYAADVLAGKYKDQEDEVEAKLSNYYLLALAQEMGSFDIALLKKLHAQHVAILNLTESSGLKIACPNTIARIESKLKLLQALK